MSVPRVPPGQRVVEGFPVLHYSRVPRINLATWRLHVHGLVETPLDLTWEDFLELPQVSLKADFHCVTHWTRLDNLWEGVTFRELAAQVRPLPEASHVLAHCYDGFTTNIPLEVLMDHDVLLARRHDGADLPQMHGWPLRLVVPKRYAWKSAKWVSGLEFLAQDRPGFWEQRGYHNDADPWKEERYGSPPSNHYSSWQHGQ